MQVLFLLSIVPVLFVHGIPTETESEVTQFCENQCTDVCHICITPTTCADNQTHCGMGQPDPNFGGICPPHPICVEEQFNCNIFFLAFPFQFFGICINAILKGHYFNFILT